MIPKPQLNTNTHELWLEIFKDAVRYAVDDAEDVVKASDPGYARRIMLGATNIADAALAAYEERWKL
jgi:hypothetical protein